ncbi:MAG: Mur ligase family protein [Pirellulales bacterium]
MVGNHGSRPLGEPADQPRRLVRLGDVLPRCRFIGAADIPARGCHDDAWQCGPGDVYVMRTTALGDGDEGLREAVARGVVGVVAERMVPSYGLPVCVVPDADWAMARLCHALAGDPAAGMEVIAVAGTSGKTTTVWLTAAILAEDGVRVGVLSDLGCLEPDAPGPVPARLADPNDLAACLGRLEAAGCTHAIIEVSSEMLARHALAGVACDTVVVTNVALAHRQRHGTRRAYEAIQGRILDCVAPGGMLIACRDDAGARRLVARWRRQGGVGAVTVGLHGTPRNAQLWATPVERQLAGQTFLLQTVDAVVPVSVTTPVQPFVRDALLAAAVGRHHGVALDRIVRGLESVGSVAGRLERINRGQAAHFFIDQPSSGHALAATLGSLRRLTTGRLVVLAEEPFARPLGGRRFARRVARWCDEAFVVPDGILGPRPARKTLEAYARIDRLLAGVHRRDCVLVLGRSFDPGRDDPDGDDGERQLGLAALVAGWFALAAKPAPRRAA